MSAPERGGLIVPAEWAGSRLDRALADHLGVTRSRVQSWLREGRVELDGRAPAKSGETLRAGAELTWNPPPAADGRLEPERGELGILFEDEHLIALDKPAGLVVHPGAGRRTGTLVARLLDRYPELAGVGGPGRPGIVHRLDLGTSGVMIVARTADAYHALVRMFAERAVDKRYLAIVWGTPKQTSGEIEAPVGRHPRVRKKMAVVARGRPARTGWRVLDGAGAVALLEVRLWTGRTHQIRLHLQHLGHPLVGDPVYGAGRARAAHGPAARAVEKLGRPALHAWRLALRHPVYGHELAFVAPIPGDLVELWSALCGRPLRAAPTD